MQRTRSVLLLSVLLLPALLTAQTDRSDRYAVILSDPPLARQSAKPMPARRAAIQSTQTSLIQQLAKRKVSVISSSQELLNAVFVHLNGNSPDDVAKLPGVARVVQLHPIHRNLVKALDLINAPQAWAAIGGDANAGAGVKIAIIDTGIDQNHPGFHDTTLTPPDGYPKCDGDACNFTNNKVIVARSYVDMLVDPDQPNISRPDDISPRDRVGHGTASAMAAAGVRHTSPLGVMSGVAPKAFLGNYKIFGSPGVNGDLTFTDIIIQALEDARDDGMNLAVLSIGTAPYWGPTEKGADCGNTGTDPCDPLAAAVETAVQAGLTVVVSAGNDGDLGLAVPSYTTVQSPGTTPAAITVGATTNSQRYLVSVRVSGDDVPDNLQKIPALFGNGPHPGDPITGPIKDVAKILSPGTACALLPNGSLTGAIALIQTGGCSFDTKVFVAQLAGASGVILARSDDSEFVYEPLGLENSGIPALLISQTDNDNLTAFLADHADREGSLDPETLTKPDDPNLVAFFSSYGPSFGLGAIKPEVVAPGQNIYSATQTFDPNGDLYSKTAYIGVQGSSFSASLVAGAAALFLQRFPDATWPQVKSAVVNTASGDVEDIDADGNRFPAGVFSIGAGKLDAEAVVKTTITSNPSTLSYGYLPATGALPTITLKLSNLGANPADLKFTVVRFNDDAKAQVTLGSQGFTLNPGETRDLTAQLTGARPNPGAYSGEVQITGGPVPIHVPFLYIVGDGVVANAIPVPSYDAKALTNNGAYLFYKLIDRYGAPVSSVPLVWGALGGGGFISQALNSTDRLGFAYALISTAGFAGQEQFAAQGGGLTIPFFVRAIAPPRIVNQGVVNAASGTIGAGLAPGSYISIFGANLAEAYKAANSTSLPLAVAGVSVSFDNPDAGISLPGRVQYVSPTQVNVQVPWELQGLTAVLIKVSIGDFSSALYNLPINNYSPAFFEYQASTGAFFIAALDLDYKVIGPDNAAEHGKAVQLFANGLGPVDNQPPTGEPAAASPLSSCPVYPTVTIGGKPAMVIFCGLAPFNVGLYQVNVIIDPTTPTGVQPVVMTINGITAKTANLVIR